LLLAGVHLSGFDLLLQAMCLHGFRGMVLTLPDLKDGFQAQFELRRRTGMDLAPASVGALRRALKCLRAGGLVVTGIDRPVTSPRHRPIFFGRPAALPTHHIKLALKADVPVVVIAPAKRPDGTFHWRTSGPIEMRPYDDDGLELQRNAERVLAVAETIIRANPCEWAMTLPVWPDALAQTPQ